MDKLFDQSLVDGLQATSVLWAFLAVLFALQYPVIVEDADSTIPDKRDATQRSRFQKQLTRTLHGRVFPLLLFLWVFAIMALPATLRIISSLDRSATYSYIKASWAFSDATLFGFAVWVSVLGFKVLLRRALAK